MADCATSSGVADKYGDRMKRLRDLHLKRNEARKLNHQEVIEEDRREKLPANYEKRQAKAEWELEDRKKRKQAEDDGDDYDRLKLRELTADDAERIARSKSKKSNPDPGFSCFEDASARSYNNAVKQFKPDAEKYFEQKQKLGDEAFYPSANTLIQGTHKDSKEAIDRMVADLDKQIEKRTKYHRRRPYDPDAQIDFINDRNMKFNNKLERFYGQYTQDIKQNIERGTAV